MTSPPSPPAAVDVHAHLVPRGLLSMVQAGDFPGLAVTDAGDQPVLTAGADQVGPAGAGITDVADRLRWMDEHAIAEQWVSPWIDLFTWHRFAPDEGRRWAAAVNETLAESVQDGSGRLRLVPAADLSAGPAAAADDVTALAERFGSPAVMLSTHPAGVSSAADESLEPLWARLADAGLPVLLHPPVNGPSRTFMPPILQNVAGRPIDTSSAVLQLMAGGLLRRLPGLRLIVVHGGGFLPYQASRLDGLVRAGLLAKTQMAEAPSIVLRRLFYDTVTLDPLSVEFLVRRVGAGQVLLGSDTPFPITDPDPVGTIRSADLSAAVRHGICCDNARALAWRS